MLSTPGDVALHPTSAPHDTPVEDVLGLDERRRAARRKVFASARFRDPSLKIEGRGTVTSLSDTGLCLQSDMLLSLGSHLAVTTALDGDTTELEGMVVWSRTAESMEDPPSAMGLVLLDESGQPVVTPEADDTPPLEDGYQLEVEDPDGLLNERVEELESFLRSCSDTLAGHLDGILRAWAATSVDTTAQHDGPQAAACQVPVSTVETLHRQVEALRDELIVSLRDLDGSTLEGVGNMDPRLAEELLDAITGLEDQVFPVVADALRQLDALGLDTGRHRLPSAANLPLPSLQAPEHALGYHELGATPVFVHDADPMLGALRTIPERSLQARPRAQGLDAYLLDVLEPSLAVLQRATGENLRAMMTNPRAELPKLLAMHSLSCACGRVADPGARERAATVKRCGQRLAAVQLDLVRALSRLKATRPLLLRLRPGHGARGLASQLARSQRGAMQRLAAIQAIIQAQAVCTHTSDPVGNTHG